MLFPTAAFAAFFVVAFATCWLLRPRYRVWQIAMIALSLWFYAAAEPRFVLLLVGSSLVNWAFGVVIHQARADGRVEMSVWLLRAAVVVNLVVLGFFKYYGFFVDAFSDLSSRFGLGLHPPVLEVLLPVGISFFTFHALSYVIDIGRGELEPLTLGDFTLYMCFFPHLVAGPIVRASELAPQLRTHPDPRRVHAGEAFRLIAGGLFKKVVISSFLASRLVDPAFGLPSQHSALDLLVAVYAYAIQIYADFSGYTDIAIGCALLLGFRFPQNFDRPYRALSLQDFWRRWHMTLSRWLRDYLYIPLGGNRGGVRRTYRNLLLTMVLGGLWHGAAWTFLVWGAIHGGFLAFERWVTGWWRATHPEPVMPTVVSTPLRWLVTFHVVCLAWIFFRAESLGAAFDIIGRILSSGGPPSTLVTGVALATIAGALVVQLAPRDAAAPLQRALARWTPAAQVGALVLTLTAIDAFGPDGVAPFIYFRF
jgi:D-alanyl-lipoteichoic acid acyltransferase DltB (MBOAT superfamily)